MKKGLLKLLIVIFLSAVLCVPALAASGTDPSAADPDADDEPVISEMSAAVGDAGTGTAAGHQHETAAAPKTGQAAAWPAGTQWAGMLKLSPDQISKFTALRDRYLAETRDLRYDLAMRHLEAMRLYTDPKTGEAALLAKQRELSALRQKLMDRRGQFTIQARGILTADQLRLIDQGVLRHLTAGFMGHGMGAMGGGMKGAMHGGGMGGAMMGAGPRGTAKMGCP